MRLHFFNSAVIANSKMDYSTQLIGMCYLLQNTKISLHMLEVLITGRMKNGVLFILKR